MPWYFARCCILHLFKKWRRERKVKILVNCCLLQLFFLLRKHYVSKLILKNIKETSSHSFKIPTSYHFHKNANNIYAVLCSMYLPISDIKNKVRTIPLNSKMYIILKVPTFYCSFWFTINPRVIMQNVLLPIANDLPLACRIMRKYFLQLLAWLKPLIVAISNFPGEDSTHLQRVQHRPIF